MMARSPAVASIVALFVCAALAWLRVIGCSRVTVPRLFSCASSVRGPPAPTSDEIVAPAALVSVFVPVTLSCDE